MPRERKIGVNTWREIHRLSMLKHSTLRRCGGRRYRFTQGKCRPYHSTSLEVLFPTGSREKFGPDVAGGMWIHCNPHLLSSSEGLLSKGLRWATDLLAPWQVMLPRTEDVWTQRDAWGHSHSSSSEEGQKCLGAEVYLRQPLYSEPIKMKLFSVET